METRKIFDDDHTGTWKSNRQRCNPFKKFKNEGYQQTGVNKKRNLKSWKNYSLPNKTNKKKCEFLEFGIDLEPTPIPSNWNKCKLTKPVISSTQNEKEIKSSASHANNCDRSFTLCGAKVSNYKDDIESFSTQILPNKDPKISDPLETSSIDMSLELTKSEFIFNDFSPRKLVSPSMSGIPCGQKDTISVNEKVEADDKLSLLHNFLNDLLPPSLPAINQRPLYFEQFDLPSILRSTSSSNFEVPVGSFSNLGNPDEIFNFSLTAGQRIADSPIDSSFQEPLEKLIGNTFTCSNHSTCKYNIESDSLNLACNKIADDDLKSSSAICSIPSTNQNEFKVPFTSEEEESSITEPVLSIHSNVTYSDNYCNSDNLDTSLCILDTNFIKELKTEVKETSEKNNYLQNDKLNLSYVENAASNTKSELAICPNSSGSLSKYDKSKMVTFPCDNSAKVIPDRNILNANVSPSALTLSTDVLTSTQNNASFKKLSFSQLSPINSVNYEISKYNIGLDLSDEVEKNCATDSIFCNNLSALTNIKSKNLGDTTNMNLASSETNITFKAKEKKLGENLIETRLRSKCMGGSHKTLSSDTAKLFDKSSSVHNLVIKLKNSHNTDVLFQPVVKLSYLPKEQLEDHETIKIGPTNEFHEAIIIRPTTNENHETILTPMYEDHETTINPTKEDHETTINPMNEDHETIKIKPTNENHKTITTNVIHEDHKIMETNITNKNHKTKILNNYDLNVELILKTIKKLFNSKKQECIKDKSIKWKFSINLHHGDNETESLTFNLNLDDRVTQSTKTKSSSIEVKAQPLNIDDCLPNKPNNAEKKWWETALLESPCTNASCKSRKMAKRSKTSLKNFKFAEKETIIRPIQLKKGNGKNIKSSKKLKKPKKYIDETESEHLDEGKIISSKKFKKSKKYIDESESEDLDESKNIASKKMKKSKKYIDESESEDLDIIDKVGKNIRSSKKLRNTKKYIAESESEDLDEGKNISSKKLKKSKNYIDESESEDLDEGKNIKSSKKMRTSKKCNNEINGTALENENLDLHYDKGKNIKSSKKLKKSKKFIDEPESDDLDEGKNISSKKMKKSKKYIDKSESEYLDEGKNISSKKMKKSKKYIDESDSEYLDEGKNISSKKMKKSKKYIDESEFEDLDKGKNLKSSKKLKKSRKFINKSDSEDSDLALAYDKEGKIILQRSIKKPSSYHRQRVVIVISDDDLNTNEISLTEHTLLQGSNKNYTLLETKQCASLNDPSYVEFNGNDSIVLEKSSKLMCENCSKDVENKKSNDLKSTTLANDNNCLDSESNITDKSQQKICGSSAIEKESDLLVPVISEKVALKLGNDEIATLQQGNTGTLKIGHEALKHPSLITTDNQIFTETSIPCDKTKNWEPTRPRPIGNKVKNRLLKMSILQPNFIFKRSNEKYTLKQQVYGETPCKAFNDHSEYTNEEFTCLGRGPFSEKATTQKPARRYKNKSYKKKKRTRKGNRKYLRKSNTFSLW